MATQNAVKEKNSMWSPPERFIIRPEDVHVSHSMRKFFEKHDVRMEINRNFAQTIHTCRMIHQSAGEGRNLAQ